MQSEGEETCSLFPLQVPSGWLSLFTEFTSQPSIFLIIIDPSRFQSSLLALIRLCRR